jgi:hypothetical protein
MKARTKDHPHHFGKLKNASSRYGTALTASKECLWPVPKLANDILYLPPTFASIW